MCLYTVAYNQLGAYEPMGCIRRGVCAYRPVYACLHNHVHSHVFLLPHNSKHQSDPSTAPRVQLPEAANTGISLHNSLWFSF